VSRSRVSTQSRVRFRSGQVETGAAWGRAGCWEPAILFLRANTKRHVVGISVGTGNKRRRKPLQIQLVMVLGDCRPGAPTYAASQLRLASHPSSIVRSSVGCPAVALAKAGEAEPIASANKPYAWRMSGVAWKDRRMLRRVCRLRLRTDLDQPRLQDPYYTGNFRFWWARPLIAVASLWPAITRTPSSIRAVTLSAVQPCRKAMPLLRQAARMRLRAVCISGG